MKYLFFLIISLWSILEASHAPAQAHFYFSRCLCSPLMPFLLLQNAELKANSESSLYLNAIQLGALIVFKEELDEKNSELIHKIKTQKHLIIAHGQEINSLQNKIDSLQNNLNNLKKLESPWLLVPSLLLGGMFIGYLCNDLKHYLFLKS